MAGACRYGYELIPDSGVESGAGGPTAGGGTSSTGGSGSADGGASANAAGGTSSTGGSAGDQSGSGGDAGASTNPTPVVAAGDQVLSTTAGSTTGGEPYAEPCPTDEALVGFSGNLAVQGFHGSLRTHCAALVVSAEPPYQVEIGSTSLGPLRGEQGDPSSPWESVCDPGEGVVRIDGRVGAFIDSFQVSCAPLQVSGQPGSFALTVGPSRMLSATGGAGGSPFAAITCPADRVAIGVNLRSGFYLDLLQLICDVPTTP